MYRPKPKDYGIDGEVEVFGEDNRATGDVFLVQLKATDATDIRNVLRLWLPIETGRYYASLDLPVLMVRYHRRTHILYIKWFHSFDLYYGRQTPKGITFRFDPSDAWTTGSAENIHNAVAAYRNTRRPSPQLPIALNVQILEPVVCGIQRYELTAMVELIGRELSTVLAVTVSTTPNTDHPSRVMITNSAIVVYIAHRPWVTLHPEKGPSESTERDTLAADVLMAVGLGLDWAGHSTLGAKILLALGGRSRLSQFPPTAAALARCLVRAQRAGDVLALAERLIVDENNPETGEVYLYVTYLALVEQPEFGTRAIAERLQIIGEVLMARGHAHPAAGVYYTTGNLLAQLSDFRAAIGLFRIARKLNCAYAQRAYFERELGGLLFLAKRYRLAVEHYRRAMALSPDRQTSLVCADALMFSGRFQEAAMLFREAIGDSDDPEDAEWILKVHALAWMATRGVPAIQSRALAKWPQKFDPRNEPDVEVEELSELVLQQDALCSLAWFNLGALNVRRGDIQTAGNCYLVAALCNPADTESWVNAAAAAFREKDATKAGLVFWVAKRTMGSNFETALVSRFPTEHRDVIFARIRELSAAMGVPKGRKPAIRLHAADGTWSDAPFGVRNGKAQFD